MAASSSFSSFCCFCRAPLLNSTSPTHFSLSFPTSILGGSAAVSLHTPRSRPATRTKFEKFQGDPPQDDDLQPFTTPSQSSSSLGTQQQAIQEEEEEDDRAITAGCFDLNEPASVGGLPMNLLLLLMAVGVACCNDKPMNLLLLLMAVGVACTVAPDARFTGEKILDIRRIL